MIQIVYIFRAIGTVYTVWIIFFAVVSVQPHCWGGHLRP